MRLNKIPQRTKTDLWEQNKPIEKENKQKNYNLRNKSLFDLKSRGLPTHPIKYVVIIRLYQIVSRATLPAEIHKQEFEKSLNVTYEWRTMTNTNAAYFIH
mgnify:CR=1 FL=1